MDSIGSKVNLRNKAELCNEGRKFKESPFRFKAACFQMS